MSENQNESVPLQQTKTERITNILSFFVSAFLTLSFIIFYPKSNTEYLMFARLFFFFFACGSGFIGGVSLIRLISNRKYIVQKYIRIQIASVLIVLLQWGILILASGVTTDLSLTGAIPRESFLVLSASAFAAGVFIQILMVYTDDIAEKFQGVKSGENAKSRARMPDKKTKWLNSFQFAGALFILFFFSIFCSEPDEEFLKIARHFGYMFPGILGVSVGASLFDSISGRKQTKPRNEGELVIFMIVLIIIVLALIFGLGIYNYYEFVRSGIILPPLLKFSGILFLAGICVRWAALYLDDFVEKRRSKKEL
ncbi:MAG: hypothetical protein LBU81_08290 [Methanosarcinales archaeon]|jgi:hypothetical protein|nr:hypothetical protein [Methanosarcinales archaeon]